MKTPFAYVVAIFEKKYIMKIVFSKATIFDGVCEKNSYMK